MALEVHHSRRVGQAVPGGVFSDEAAQLITGDEELAGECVGKALASELGAGHGHDDVDAAGVEERMRHLVRRCEHLAAEGHVGVDDDGEANLGVVVEEPGWCAAEILAERKTPDEEVLVGDPEHIAKRTTTKVQVAAELTGCIGGIARS